MERTAAVRKVENALELLGLFLGGEIRITDPQDPEFLARWLMAQFSMLKLGDDSVTLAEVKEFISFVEEEAAAAARSHGLDETGTGPSRDGSKPSRTWNPRVGRDK